MSLRLFWTLAVTVFAAAMVFLYWGLWGDRSKDRLRCPKCWYRMEGSFVAGAFACPECGHDARQEKRLKKNHRRWWVMMCWWMRGSWFSTAGKDRPGGPVLASLPQLLFDLMEPVGGLEDFTGTWAVRWATMPSSCILSMSRATRPCPCAAGDRCRSSGVESPPIQV